MWSSSRPACSSSPIAQVRRSGTVSARARIYDRWLQVLRAVDPRFEFTDPPVRHSLPVALALAETAGRPAVLTGPTAIAAPPPGVIRLPRPAGTGEMARVGIADHPLTRSCCSSL